MGSALLFVRIGPTISARLQSLRKNALQNREARGSASRGFPCCCVRKQGKATWLAALRVSEKMEFFENCHPFYNHDGSVKREMGNTKPVA